MVKPQSIFPEEITNKELAYEVGRYTIKKIMKVSKSTQPIKLAKIKIRMGDDAKSYTIIYTFTDKISQQIAGIFASTLEDVTEHKISSFDVIENSLTLIFSSEKIPTNEEG